MNEEQILEKIKENLKQQIGNQLGGSGHLSNVTVSDIKIEGIEETIRDGKTVPRVQYSYTVDIEFEFLIAKDNELIHMTHTTIEKRMRCIYPSNQRILA